MSRKVIDREGPAESGKWAGVESVAVDLLYGHAVQVLSICTLTDHSLG